MEDIQKDYLLPLNEKKIAILDSVSSNFSTIEQIWLSGYFWGLSRSGKNKSPIKNVIENEFVVTILSASQTGNARELSKLLYEKCKLTHIKANLVNAFDYQFKKINKEKIFIIITSTQGEGEPPEEALDLYNFLMSKKAPKLNNFYYSVFGLGDSSYNLFCQSGKDFDKKLCELGGIRLLDRVDADIEYIEIAKKWCDDILKKINTLFKSKNNTIDGNILGEEKSVSSIVNYTKEKPFFAKLCINKKITGRHSIRDIRHIEIDITNSGIIYKPGDVLGIWYENDPCLIKEFLELLNIKEDTLVKFNKEDKSIFNLLKNNFELTVNNIHVVSSYAKLSNSKTLQNIVLDKKKLKLYADKVSIINMIREYPIKENNLCILEILRPMIPRLYSISSSLSEVENEIHITVRVLKHFHQGKIYLGGASGYLAHRVEEDDILKIFVVENNHFRLPTDNNMPIIMICAGTGIAPFRAFMQERDFQNAKGKNWLFFGNPSFTEDFLYQIEWQRYFKKGLLTNIDLAWSRDQKNKIYVQDKIREKGNKIWNWIKEGAYIYICGDASNMAKGVESAFLDIFIQYDNMDLVQAKKFLNNLRIEKRYQRDLY
ncbi:assimilatory sulfite reductase (NADPH) flavoprotein subunit [Buchnera aphidicola (Pemphigus obesinymphae)]|uniref:assimilatory sulfite reductase (NADPH) flavoprotein subunit n=1 Tax=Buchnera aphidicola TaxID=9 RepID=UPI002237CDB6|nr:assimilatory sulfite reductase (NADPH) flavoprotein subunit [Buchnera aphidicola]MCW5196719.1 assimilatory sulfite reductase (NADPH) flavoprotein subunit [Buchnera aphidicola (Pemphigus obesinymphae)]